MASLSYSIKCRRCRYSRVYGNARITAETKAVSHSLRMGHIVDIHLTDLETLTSTVHWTVGHEPVEQEGIPF